MSVRTDTINLNLNVNSNKAQEQLNTLRKRAADVRFEMDGLKKGTAEYVAKSKELSQVNAQMDQLKKEIGITALSQKELIAELNKLKALRGSVVPFTAEYKELSAQIKQVENRLYDVKNGVQGFASFFSKIKDEVKQFGMVAASYLGFQFITQQFQSVIQNSGRLSDQLADLQRVAGLTAEEAQKLNSSFKELDTRTSTSGLRDIAIIAGKLGVAKEDIMDFTQAVDQLVVSLGDELGSAEEITDQLGKIVNVFNGEINAEGISKLGNVFVQLANTGAATGKFIADFDQRLSGIAKSSGISLGALSGLGAGLEEMGARVESSSTAIQKLIVTIASDIPKSAKIAGMSTADFSKLFKKDATEALLRFSEGLVKNKSSFEEVTSSLKDAGEEGARTIEVISKLGTASDQLRKRIDLGKESIQETTAITEAFNLKNETFGATIDQIGKEFNRLMSSSAITGFIQGLTGAFLSFLKALQKAPQFFKENSTGLSLLITGILLMNASYLKSALLILNDTRLKIANSIATRGAAAATVIAEVATAAYITVTNLLTGKINLATAALRLWNIAMSVGAGGFGILVAGIGAAVIALNNFLKSGTQVNSILNYQAQAVKEAANAISKERSELDSLTKIAQDNSISLHTREEALKKLIAISPEYLGRLTMENITTREGQKILNEYNNALQQNAVLKASSNIKDKEYSRKVELEGLKQELEMAKSLGKGYGDLSDDLKKLFTNSTSVGRMAFTSDLLNLSIKDSDWKEAIDNVNQQISNQDKNLEAASQNFVNQTKISEWMRQNFLAKELKAALAEFKKQTAGTSEYEKALLRLIELKKTLDKEFPKNSKSGVGDIIAPKATPGNDTPDPNKKVSSSNTGEYDRILAEAKKFQAEIEKLKKRTEEGGKTPEQDEIDRTVEKYQQLLSRAKEFYIKHAISQEKFGEDEKIIAEAKQKELNEIYEKYFKQRLERSGKEEYKSAQGFSSEAFDEQRAKQAQMYSDGEISKLQYETRLKEIEKLETNARINIAEEYSASVKEAADDVVKFKKDKGKAETADLVDQTNHRLKLRQQEDEAALNVAVQKNSGQTITGNPYVSSGYTNAIKDQALYAKEQKIKALKDTYEALGEVMEEGNSQLEEINEEYNQKITDADQQHAQAKIGQIQAYVGYMQQAMTSLNTFISNREIAAFNKEKALNDKKKKEFKSQLDNKLISQGQYDKKMTALQEEQDKKERELKRKQAKREKAMNLFKAIVNVAAGVASSLSYGGPVGIALAAITAVLGALEIAAIASEPLPEAARGKWYKEGNKHSEGGIPIEIERGEAVMTAAAMDDKNKYTITGTPAQITSALNSQSGGVSWAGGAIVKRMSHISDRSISFNPNLPKYAAGGGTVETASELQLQGVDDETKNILRGILNETKSNTDEIKNMKTKLHAIVSVKEFRDAEKLYDDSKKLSGLSKTGN